MAESLEHRPQIIKPLGTLGLDTPEQMHIIGGNQEVKDACAKLSNYEFAYDLPPDIVTGTKPTGG